MKGKVCFFLVSSSEYVHETRSGYKKEPSGIWKTVKRWFSLYEIKEAASRGVYEWYYNRARFAKRHTSMDAEAWTLRDYGRNPSCGAC